MNKLYNTAYKCILALTLLLLVSCGNRQKRYVIGVSQCSEDTWREKLNEELRIAALYYNDVDLRISSAGDNVRLQTEQIEKFVDEGVDLLVVAPGQVTISPAIDRAYEKGIPVIVFDRRTRSDKYTAYIGADNHDIGASMGEFVSAAFATEGGAHVVEVCGLASSSPAIERQNGFDSVASKHPNIDIVATVHSDWTERGAYSAMDSILSHPHPDFDCVFAHNDRMAIGARRAAMRHGLDTTRIKFCGIDAMPQKGGGMQLVDDGTLFASYIYPTRGDEVMALAMDILEGRQYKREHLLSAALVTADNAGVLLMQNDEIMRQQGHLATLRSRVDKTAAEFNTQRAYLLVLIILVVLLTAACAMAIRAYMAKTRINRRLKDSMNRQQAMTEKMERMTQTQLQFFTNVSHELRTPLTLIAGPANQLLDDPSMKGQCRTMLEMVQRNAQILTRIVGDILDFKEKNKDKAGLSIENYMQHDAANKAKGNDNASDADNVARLESAKRITNVDDGEDGRPLVLVIDDNADMRAYIRSILCHKYNVAEAADGRQGLERARREVPKLVVCDVMMPVMDGLEFTRRLKHDTATSHIPVILLTARSLTEQRAEGYGTGADSYMTKPFSGAVLLARIENLMESRNMLRSIFSGGLQEKEEEEQLGTQDKSFVDRLRDIMQRNLHDSDFSIERLGEEIGLSRVQLYRKAKALTGQTPVELLRKARLEKARRMVEKTDQSIAEIAYEVGFTSPSYFNKCFKDEFGTSPGALREQ